MFFLLLIFLLSACQNSHSPIEDLDVNDYSFKTLIFAESLEILDQERVNSYRPVNLIKGQESALLSVITFSEKRPIKLCLFADYERLFWHEVATHAKCENAPTDLRIYFPMYKNVQVYFFKQDRRLDSQTLVKRNHLTFKTDDQIYSFPLKNIEKRQIFPLAIKARPHPVLRDQEICYEVDENCRVLKNLCHQCENSFMPVIAAKCGKDFTKVCASESCGQRNQPACVRGYHYQDVPITPGCFDMSAAGYCHPNLKAYCDERGVLVCR